MVTWNEFLDKEGHPPECPYPVNYENQQEIEVDVLVLGGGIAGGYKPTGNARPPARFSGYSRLIF
ncbi:MAG: hypothetical protein A2Z29_10130 [Chloroflexi bacterium RBG_16_56_11]|nr:MAG: hypothetical protein A2Z29_10130 [Chloroflexi bacterium RBG_16_56_11]